MVRWEPDSRGRLEAAALELYGERGFEQTTVADIAERAGVSERTFFRHFADKREVLFAGSGRLQELLVGAIAEAPESLPPLEAAVAGVRAAGALLEQRREFSRRRQAIIMASTELTERELIKLATLAAGVADALRARGVQDPAAVLTGELSIAVFRIAVERWNEEGNEQPLVEVIGESLDQVRSIAA